MSVNPVWQSTYGYKHIGMYDREGTVSFAITDSTPFDKCMLTFLMNVEDEEALLETLSIRKQLRDIRNAQLMNAEFDRRMAVRKFYTRMLVDFPTLEVADGAFDAILSSFNQNENVLGEKFGIEESLIWH